MIEKIDSSAGQIDPSQLITMVVPVLVMTRGGIGEELGGRKLLEIKQRFFFLSYRKLLFKAPDIYFFSHYYSGGFGDHLNGTTPTFWNGVIACVQ